MSGAPTAVTDGAAIANPFLEPALLTLGRGARILDLGCGNGFWLQRMVAGGLDVVGLEVAEPLARRAAHIAPVIVGSGRRLPLRDGSVDLVWCAHVLHHDRQPWQLLAEIRRVLRPSGHLLLAETVQDSPLVRAARAIHPAWDGVPVRSRFTSTQLLDRLGAAGFEVRELRRHSAIALVAWLLPRGQLRAWQRLRALEERLPVALERWSAHLEVIAR